MTRKVKDGWHTVKCGPWATRDVYIENGKVLRGLAPSETGMGLKPIYPYHACKAKYGGGWDICTPTLDALRAGLRRGTYILS